MEIKTLAPESWKVQKVQIEKAIDTLKKEMVESKKVRKLDWKSLKSKYKVDKTILETSLKNLKTARKRVIQKEKK
jgi:hypothetical protein